MNNNWSKKNALSFEEQIKFLMFSNNSVIWTLNSFSHRGFIYKAWWMASVMGRWFSTSQTMASTTLKDCSPIILISPLILGYC